MKKSFLLFLISLCFGIITFVLWTGPAYAPPPGCSPVAQNLAECHQDLDVCEEDLAACDAGCSVFPGDGYPNPDDFDVSGHGPALSYTDNGDGTFTDNNTKLIWEKKLAADVSDGGNCTAGSQADRSVHCLINGYLWSLTSEDPDGTLFTDFLYTLNNTCKNDETVDCSSNGDSDCSEVGGPCGFAGHRDWRIPNVRELQSLVDYERYHPAVDPTLPGAINPDSASYWSSTTHALVSHFAWDVDFVSGGSGGESKLLVLNARAVRP